MGHAWAWAIGGALLAMVGVALAAAGETNASIQIGADGEVASTDPAEHLTLADHTSGEHYNWTVGASERTRLDVHLAEDLAITRGEQMVPWADGRHLVEASANDLDEATGSAFNVSATEEGWTYEIELAAAVEIFELERDVTPPGIEIVSVGNRTHVAFDATTNTSENALATLVVNGPSEDVQRLSTPRPGPWQHFPVQGLNANTTYRFFVNATDWSGNRATSETVEVSTTQAPNPPEPTVRPVRPEPNATVRPDEVVVEASFVSQDSPANEVEVRLFFDKEPVDRRELTVRNGTVAHDPGRLAERTYFVTVEVPNEAGGVGIARWSFDVDDPRTAPMPVAAGLLALLAAGLNCRTVSA